MAVSTCRRFDGVRALVVGGGADGPARPGESLAMGNGRAIALRISAEGARVAVTDLDGRRAADTVEALDGEGLALVADAGDPDACRSAVAAVEAAWGGIDVVVLNVAVSGHEPLRAQTHDDWVHSMSVNAEGHWVTVQAALPGMLERGGGTFVFIGSTAGTWSSGRSMSYEASKAAQMAVMRHVAVRYAARGIRANAAVLGVIDSTMVRREFGSVGGARDAVSPMRRQGTPEEVAAAVAFLAAAESSYVNGQELVIDGGVTASWPAPPSPPPPAGASTHAR